MPVAGAGVDAVAGRAKKARNSSRNVVSLAVLLTPPLLPPPLLVRRGAAASPGAAAAGAPIATCGTASNRATAVAGSVTLRTGVGATATRGAGSATVAVRPRACEGNFRKLTPGLSLIHI